MKTKLTPRLLILAALYFFFSGASFAQNSREGVRGNARHEAPAPGAKAQTPIVILKETPTPTDATSNCDNDVTAPEVQCATGNCLPTARAAYLVSYNGEPWGQYNNIEAMEAVFGSGNWDALYFEDADVATLFSPAYKVIFLDGSDSGPSAFEAFLTANLPALENWVSAGGALFVNCAPNSGSLTINLGFGGVTLHNYSYTENGVVQTPGHPVFNQPFAPANGDFYGSAFLHGTLHGPIGLFLITSIDGIGLSEKTWGAGKVYFGTMTMPYYHSPQPNAQNMRQNILADLNALCYAGVIVPADAGQCAATVSDQSLDATATDDCEVVSLTHDFAGAPDNTTLSGAVFPVGATLVRWTAADAAGNSGTCEFTVLVQESEAPTVTCPDDVLVPADPEVCGATVNFVVTATDNCSATPTIVANPASGGNFANGSTTVQAYATDESGNQSTCSFEVTVTPNPELCNGLDDDCNGYIDDGAPADLTFYLDADYDGYGDPNNTILACPAPYGYVDNALDCDDTNYYIQPGMYEYCNGVDDNCDGNIDEGYIWYIDTDGDGFGDPAVTQNGCDQPQGYVFNNVDCDDTNSYIHPGALEDCTNLTDENCDGILGENNFTIEETHTDVFCGSNPDGTISLTIAPAQNYPVIHWSNGACCTTTLTNLDHGTYTVTVANECGTTKTKTIIIQPSPTPTLQVTMSGTEYICSGAGNGTVTATPQDGCGDYTYVWNTGATVPSLSGLSGGYYTVVVTDACGCTQTGTFTVNEPDAPYLYFGAVIPLLDGTYFVETLVWGGTSPYQFRRSTPSGFTNWTSSNGFVNVLPGDYVFEVQDINGCTAQAEISLSQFSPRPINNVEDPAVTQSDEQEPAFSMTDTRQQSSGSLDAAGQDWSVSLFPNPNTGAFTVELPQPAVPGMAFGITDINGRLVFNQQTEADNSRQSVQAGDLPNGLYFLQVVLAGKVVAVERFVKQ